MPLLAGAMNNVEPVRSIGLYQWVNSKLARHVEGAPTAQGCTADGLQAETAVRSCSRAQPTERHQQQSHAGSHKLCYLNRLDHALSATVYAGAQGRLSPESCWVEM